MQNLEKLFFVFAETTEKEKYKERNSKTFTIFGIKFKNILAFCI